MLELSGIVPVTAVPSTVVVDPGGRVAARVIGRVEWLTGDEVGQLVQEIGELYADTAQISALLKRLAASYPQR
jgi:protein involved in polysaccharide export with SLBB domain